MVGPSPLVYKVYHFPSPKTDRPYLIGQLRKLRPGVRKGWFKVPLEDLYPILKGIPESQEEGRGQRAGRGPYAPSPETCGFLYQTVGQVVLGLRTLLGTWRLPSGTNLLC